MFDLQPATQELTAVVTGVRDDQLTAPTPCAGMTVGDLLDHVDGLSVAFAAAAAKTLLPGSQTPSADGARLASDWRTRIPERLASLAQAWREETAWTGMTQVGGVELPGEVCAAVAANEALVHAWDLAVATGQPYTYDQSLVSAASEFVAMAVADNPQGTPGLFGPPVPVPDDAPAIDRLVALTGRNPAWRAPVAATA